LADGTTTRGRIVVAACGGGVVVVLVVVLVVVAVVAICGTGTGRRGRCGWGDGWVVHHVGLALIQTQSSRTGDSSIIEVSIIE
jgi:hypothetical protein